MTHSDGDTRPSLATDIRDEAVRVLARQLDEHSRLLERLEILADRRGDRAGALRTAAKLLRATAEGGCAIQRALDSTSRLANAP